TPLRMDSVALGSFVALAARGNGGVASLCKGAWAAFLVGGVTVAAIVLLRQTVSHSDPWFQSVGYSALAATFGGLLVLAVTFEPLRRLFSNSVLCWFGKYSYGLYVWHPIVFILVL